MTLQDIAPDGGTEDVTAGWLRASLREIDEAASRPGAGSKFQVTFELRAAPRRRPEREIFPAR